LLLLYNNDNDDVVQSTVVICKFNEFF